MKKSPPERNFLYYMPPRPASPHDSAASPSPLTKRSETEMAMPTSKEASVVIKPRLRGKLHRSAAYAAAAAGASMVASASRVSAQAGWACLIYT